MTLIKKMSIGALILLSVIFLITYSITVYNARDYFIEQLNSNAQDTATSLGLSLSHSLAKQDKATMLAMVEAVFDRGYFASIDVRDNRGTVLVSRHQPDDVNGIPKWFKNLFHFTPKIQSSLVMSGWNQVGEVQVTSRSSYVYAMLWTTAMNMIETYIIMGILAILIVYAFISWLLKPLERVTEQAMAISAHEFPVVKKIPKTPELRELTVAMNQMVEKIKSLFDDQKMQTEQLRTEVYQDQLTGFSNRRHFLQRLTALLDNQDEFVPGYVIMLVLDGLDDYNQVHGYQKGDELILTVSKQIDKYWNLKNIDLIARINGSTFALISHEPDHQIFTRQCIDFERELNNSIHDVVECQIHMGASAYFTHQSTSNLLTMVDTAVKKARTDGMFFSETQQDKLKYPRLILGEDMMHALNHDGLRLYAQNVVHKNKVLHREVYVRMLDKNGEELGAGYFMPLAERYEKAHLIDLQVLHIISQRFPNPDIPFALNLSMDTIVNIPFQQNYIAELQRLPETLRNHLHIELSEQLAIKHFDVIHAFIQKLHELGIQFGIDRSGVHFTPLNYLSELNLDYIKLHGSLVQDIDENESKQFFIHYFNEMAKTMDIHVIATQVEHESQWSALVQAHIYWGQGRYLAAIEPLSG